MISIVEIVPLALLPLFAYSIKRVACTWLKQEPKCSAHNFLYNTASFQAATSKSVPVEIEKRRQNSAVEIAPQRFTNKNFNKNARDLGLVHVTKKYGNKIVKKVSKQDLK